MNGNKIGNQKTIGNRLGIMATAILLLAMIFAVIPTAEAYTVGLRITDTNLNVLQSSATWTAYGSGELMLWPSLLDATPQYQLMVGTIGAVQVRDGECVSLVKALSKSSITTVNWIQGDSVMKSYFTHAQPGDTIATFTSTGKYSPGHAAIFRGYYYNNIGQRIGIWVWDQNYIPDHGHAVARHVIYARGVTTPTDPNNANNYYTIRVTG